MGDVTLPRPRALLFDWDNTLVDTWPCIARATNITLETMGLPTWSPEEIRIRVAGSLRDTFPAIYGDRWEKAREIYYRAFEAVHLEMLTPLPGAEALLKSAAPELILGVVSNKTGKYLRKESNHLGWDEYFNRLIGAQDADRDKPAPEPIHLALEGSGVTAGPDVWFVGDAPIDVECGRAAGCTTILVHGGDDRTPLPAPVPAPLPAHGRAADCDALAALVRATLAGPSV